MGLGQGVDGSGGAGLRSASTSSPFISITLDSLHANSSLMDSPSTAGLIPLMESKMNILSAIKGADADANVDSLRLACRDGDMTISDIHDFDNSENYFPVDAVTSMVCEQKTF